MRTPLRLLLVEDHLPDAELMVAELRRSGFDPMWACAADTEEFETQLAESWDIILADFMLPQFNALNALKVLRSRQLDTPLIVVTGAVGEEVAVECIKQGAADYLLKDRLARLGSAVRQVLEQARMRKEAAQTHRALLESEQRFRALIEHSSSGMLLLDPAGNILRRYHDLFAGEGASDHFFEWMLVEDRPGVRQTWERLGDGIQTTQFRIPNGRGGTHWIEATCQDLRSTPGVAAIVVHYRDITSQRQLEEQLRQSQKMEAVGQLAAGLGHDFNNLLTIMSGYSSVLLRHSGLAQPVLKGLGEIQDACRRASLLTRELLTFSRKQVRRAQVLDPNQAIRAMVPLLESLLGESVTLELKLSPGAGHVLSGEGELEQVIMNLAVNARDAMSGLGSLTIETSTVEPDSEGLGALQKSPQVMICVSDTGCGMSSELQARIFEPFFTTKDVGKGTGLGLSTVYAIVTHAGGHVLVESRERQGATFRLLLPRTDQAPAPKKQLAPVSVKKPANETILLVEDDNRVRSLICAILEPLGYTIISAGNVAEAIACWRTRSPEIDLLVTDVRMPGGKGTELARELRKDRARLGVLFMSGYVGADGDDTGIGSDPLLSKPFSPDALVQAVGEALAAAPRQESVLIVDDDAQIRSFLRVVLEAEGYEIREASNGRLALALIKENCPETVITDLVMPDTEGIELIQKMRQIAKGITIIAMSGAGQGTYLDGAILLGADAAVGKPIDIDHLLATIRRGRIRTRGGVSASLAGAVHDRA